MSERALSDRDGYGDSDDQIALIDAMNEADMRGIGKRFAD